MERTTYMQSVMTATYPQIVIEAINGGFALSWERCIARQLVKDAQADKSEAVLILESCGNDVMKAAKLITGSKPQEMPPLVSPLIMVIDNEAITL